MPSEARIKLCVRVEVGHWLACAAISVYLIWTYGIQLWGTTSNSEIEILERFQSKVLRLIVDATWYV
jgi:hypothetical protein